MAFVARFDGKTVRDIAFRNDTAFVAQNLNGMATLNVANPAQPRPLRDYDPDMIQPLALRVHGDRLLVADRFRGFCIWNIEEENEITTISQVKVPGIATHFDTFELGSRKYAAVAVGGEGLAVVDYTDETSPSVIGQFRIDIDYTRYVSVKNKLAFVADNSNGGLKVIDLLNPDKPELLQKVLMPGYWESATLQDNLLFTAHRSVGFRVFNVGFLSARNERSTTPSVALLCTVIRSKNNTRHVMPDGNLAFVADDRGGLDLYDISNPSAPLLRDEFRTEHTAVMTVKYRDHYYVPCWDAGVYVLQIVQ